MWVIVAILIIFAICIYFGALNNKKIEKGKEGENSIVNELKRLGIKGEIYQNIYITFKNGSSTEIDILFVTDKLIFVIESKNYSGKIFGDLNSSKWIVHYGNGSFFKFYSPVMQNNGHIRALSTTFHIEEGLLESIVVFGDKSDISNIRGCEECIQLKNLRYYIINKYRQSRLKVDNRIRKGLHNEFKNTYTSILTRLKHVVFVWKRNF